VSVLGRLDRNYTIVLFDLDGTLRFNRPSSTKAFYDCAANLGAQDGSEQRRRAMQWMHSYWANSVALSEDLRLYPDDDLFWSNYAVRSLLAFGCTAEEARCLAPDVHRYMREEHRPVSWTPPETMEILSVLQQAGMRLGVLSNRDRSCQEELAELGLLKFFELALVAGELSAWKPDPLIFLRTLERMGAGPEQAVYVGDNYYADVIGAQRAGLTPILYDPEEIFPDAECTVVRTLGEIPVLLGMNDAF
jgi:HAD superfamily hydrolase (TIGR01509 family)